MKAFLSLAAALCVLLCLTPALAKVYVDQTPPEDWQERELLRITVFRTGEGDAMLIQAGGENMMVDGGPYKYREKLRDALKDRGIDRFQYLFNTHPHDDHIDGLRMLMVYGFEADAFVSVFPKNYNYENQRDAMARLDKTDIPYRQLANGDTLSLGDAELTVFQWEAGKSINAKSAALRLEFGNCAALLCADIVGETQKHFLSALEEGALKADVVKAPHHGLTPFVSDFLTAVDPEYIFVTNYENSKVSKTKGQANYRNLPIHFSGDGTIYLECDGTDWYVRQTLKTF